MKCAACGCRLPLTAGGLSLAPGTGEIAFGDATSRLQPTSTRLMQMLMEADGEYVSHATITAELFPGRISKNVEVHVHKIRAALRALTNRVQIDSAWGKGYRLVGDATSSTEGNSHVQ